MELNWYTGVNERTKSVLMKYCFYSIYIVHAWILSNFTSCRFAPVAARGRVYPALSSAGSHGVPQLTSFTELPVHIFPMLLCLGPYIAVDPLLFAKVS